MSNYYNRQWRLPNAWNGTESNQASGEDYLRSTHRLDRRSHDAARNAHGAHGGQLRASPPIHARGAAAGGDPGR